MSTHPQSQTRGSGGCEVVVVSGLPRSGTSMVMAMLAAGGLQCVSDGARAADEDNPKGYFEDQRVTTLGADADWLRTARGRVVKIVSPLLAHIPAGLECAVVFIRRDLDEILASQAKMMKRRGEQPTLPDDQMKRYFEDHLRRVHEMLENRTEMRVMDVEHRETLADPDGQARSIAEFLRRPLDLERMAAVVDQRLYRNRRD